MKREVKVKKNGDSEVKKEMILVLCVYLSVSVPSGHAVNSQLSVSDRLSTLRGPCHRPSAPQGDSVGQVEGKGKRERKEGRKKDFACILSLTVITLQCVHECVREPESKCKGVLAFTGQPSNTKLSPTLSAIRLLCISCQRCMCTFLYLFYLCELWTSCYTKAFIQGFCTL